MVLCLGPAGAGKTLLLSRLQTGPTDSNNSPSPGSISMATIPTVGTNLVSLPLGQKKRQGFVVVRELGGAMAPIWPQYYRDTNAILYVVDACNKCQVSAATMLLLDVLRHPDLQRCSVLIVFNKKDISCNQTAKQLEALMRLPDILRNATQTITVLHASAKLAEGFQGIREWLQSVA